MLVVDYQTIQSHLADYCEKISDHDEEIHIQRMGDQDIVMISMGQYQEMATAFRTIRRLEKIQRNIDRIEAETGQAYRLSAFEILRQGEADADQDEEITPTENQGIVIIPMAQYQEMAKALRNMRYLSMIQDGIDEIQAGKYQVHPLIETED